MATNTEFKKEVDRVSVELKKSSQYPYVYALNVAGMGTNGMVDSQYIHIVIKNIANSLDYSVDELLEALADRHVKMTALNVITRRLKNDIVSENK